MSSSLPIAMTKTTDRAVWLAGAALALCIFGLVHDPAYLGTNLGVSESDENIEQEEKFQRSVDAAPLQRKLGFIGMLAVGAVCFLKAPPNVRIYWGPLTWLVILSLAWATGSYLWSADRNETARELVRLTAYAFVGAGAGAPF